MTITAFDLAQRYIGIHELGTGNHPLIQWWLSLCSFPLDSPDETPWCAAFLNGIAWELRLPRSKSAAARSWLKVGIPVLKLEDCRVGFDVVILNRGGPQDAMQPGPGHVGLFAGVEGSNVILLAGNQGDAVSLSHFPVSRILGIRRLA